MKKALKINKPEHGIIGRIVIMKKGKYVKKSKNKNSWLIVIIALVAVVFAVVLVITQSWQSDQLLSEDVPDKTDAVSVPDKIVIDDETKSCLEDNAFFVDLSCSGAITDIDGEICFVADQMYRVEIDGEVYENVNIFCLTDPNYQEWAEQAVTVRASAIAQSDEKFMLDLQYIVCDDVCVSTPFSEYHFSAEWADRLIVNHSYSDTFYKVDFYADMDEKQEYLFSIIMGEEEGTPIGKLTDTMDSVTMVYLLNREDDFAGYSQTDQDYLHSMMEGINYLIDELEKNPQFSNEF